MKENMICLKCGVEINYLLCEIRRSIDHELEQGHAVFGNIRCPTCGKFYIQDSEGMTRNLTIEAATQLVNKRHEDWVRQEALE